MIDIHAHILPGLDDGPSAIDESIEMARVAADDGIDTIVAMPHSLNGLYINRREEVLSACVELNLLLEEHGVHVTILPGSEVYMGLEILDELKNNMLMTINDTGRYFSMELPPQFVPETVISFIKRLKADNITPIIPHPERNTAIQNKPEILGGLISAGALSQVTAGSLTGGFGRYARNCAIRIVEQKMIHLLGSDAHSPGERPPRISGAFESISSLAGRDIADEIIYKNPLVILDGKPV